MCLILYAVEQLENKIQYLIANYFKSDIRGTHSQVSQLVSCLFEELIEFGKINIAMHMIYSSQYVFLRF